MTACSALARGPELHTSEAAVRSSSLGTTRGSQQSPTAGAPHPESAATAPKPGETAPAPLEALRATANADPTRVRPEAGYVVRVRGVSARATIILPHPEQRDLLQVRWNTSMRQTSTIGLAEITSMAPPPPKRRRVPTAANRTDPTANDRTTPAAGNRSAPTNASRAGHTTDASAGLAADDTTAPATDGQTDPTARGRSDPAAGDRANPTTERGTDPTADRHAGPDARGSLTGRAKATHDNPGPSTDNRKRQRTTVDMADVAPTEDPQRGASPAVAIGLAVVDASTSSAAGPREPTATAVAGGSRSPDAPLASVPTAPTTTRNVAHGERHVRVSSSAADTENAPATCSRTDPAVHGHRDPAAYDHANPTAEGCADSTADHHTVPGAAVHSGVPPAAVEQDDQSGARARPGAGFVIRVRGESASATVILPHPEQRDLLQVRWNTSMRQTSTIELVEVTSAEPRQSKRPRVPATKAGACPAARNSTGPAADDPPRARHRCTERPHRCTLGRLCCR